MKNFILSIILFIGVVGFSLAQNDTTITERVLPETEILIENCTSCVNTITDKGCSAIGYGAVATGQYTFSSGYLSRATGQASTALGSECDVSMEAAFAVGHKCVSSGVTNIAMGYEAKATGRQRCIAMGNFAQALTDGSVAIGSFVQAAATSAFVIGTGKNGEFLVNRNFRSLMVGFNSPFPTFFVGETPNGRQSGSVSVGTDVIESGIKFQVQSDAGLDARVLIKPKNFESGDYAELQFGDQYHYIRSENGRGMTIYDKTQVKFMGGNVGIGTTPIEHHKLHVDGNIMVSGATSSILFAADDKAEEWGRWGIEYHDGGLNFWTPYPSNEKYGNYKVFLDDSAGYMALGHNRPTERLDVMGNMKITGMNNSLLIEGLKNTQTNMVLTTNEEGLVELKSAPNHHIASRNIELRGHYLSGDGGDEGVYVKENGFVGIGHNNPASLLHVKNSGEVDARISSGSASKSAIWSCNTVNACGIGVDVNGKGHIYQNYNAPLTVMTFSQGKVAIGEVASMPSDYKLYVGGGIIAEKVRVRLSSNWADYVFDDDYEILSLSEIERFVKQYKHLPGVPSAQQVQEEGIDVAEMNAILLTKIEELTLLVIDLEKEVKQLKAEK